MCFDGFLRGGRNNSMQTKWLSRVNETLERVQKFILCLFPFSYM